MLKYREFLRLAVAAENIFRVVFEPFKGIYILSSCAYLLLGKVGELVKILFGCIFFLKKSIKIGIAH